MRRCRPYLFAPIHHPGNEVTIVAIDDRAIRYLSVLEVIAENLLSDRQVLDDHHVDIGHTYREETGACIAWSSACIVNGCAIRMSIVTKRSATIAISLILARRRALRSRPFS